MDYLREQTGWNIAADYSRGLIFKHIQLYDYYITIAETGTSDLFEDINMPNQQKDLLRIRALVRAIIELESTINNSLFNIRKKNKEEFEGYLGDLQIMKRAVNECKHETYNQRDKVKNTKINEKAIKKMIDDLRKIYRVVTDLINKAGLLFPPTNEVDPDEWERLMDAKITDEG